MPPVIDIYHLGLYLEFERFILSENCSSQPLSVRELTWLLRSTYLTILDCNGGGDGGFIDHNLPIGFSQLAEAPNTVSGQVVG